MYCLTDLCCLCLVNGKTIRSVILEDDDGIVVKNKLEYVLSEAKNFLSEVLKNICTACLNTLNYVYQFKRECLQNLISLNNYIERMAPVPQEYISFDQHAELQNQMRSANHFIANASENPKQKCAMNIPECTVTSHNSKYPLIPENNKEIEIVKHELQYFNDEIDIKHDPLLLDGGDSEEKSRNDFPKEPTNSEFSTNSMNSETKTKHQKTTQQYKCHVCNKGFRERCYLEKHSRSHTSVPPFECETCHKTFGTSNNLERHRHAHIGEVSDKFTLANDKPSTSEIYEEPSNHFLSAFIEDQQQMIHKNIRVAPSSQEYNADKELLEIQNPQSVCETQMKENFEEVVIKVEANVDDDMKNTEVQYESSDEEMPENTHERTSATNYNGDRFGRTNVQDNNNLVQDSVSKTTKRSNTFIWNQFMAFCNENEYNINVETSKIELAAILQYWAYDMRRKDGMEYKESVVKLLWNGVAKLLQEKYFNEFGKTVNPLHDIEFQSARDARNAKRRKVKQYHENVKLPHNL